ncbi:hypothetical protein RRG08_026346 [Elysia crispata]|uniref:Uncharacterized protein n=1 Tax=Elysia crispata TaxID=231223 RepID=A0AAE0XNB3_9GAST|nr:hypothetical protein RRG08_026346 [Elysia crispata]
MLLDMEPHLIFDTSVLLRCYWTRSLTSSLTHHNSKMLLDTEPHLIHVELEDVRHESGQFGEPGIEPPVLREVGNSDGPNRCRRQDLLPWRVDFL